MTGLEALSNEEVAKNIASPPRLAEPKRFRLTGPSRIYDPRVHAVRPDLADIALADWIFAPHYVEAHTHRVTSAALMVRAAPSPDAIAVSQLLKGEQFAVLEARAGWAWGYCGHDHYVGYVPLDGLGPLSTLTHRVATRETILFTAADIKSPARGILSLGVRLTGSVESNFLHCTDGFVPLRHLVPVSENADDAVAVAAQMLGAPYLWGGRGAGGIDCSGLVQIALEATGSTCPRDSDQQRALGTELSTDAPLQRGDLVFFPGHVGLMVDSEQLLHANAHWMSVVIEPLQHVVDRLLPTHEHPIVARRRL